MQAKKKLLIADPSHDLIQTITSSSQAIDYDIITALSGTDALHKIQTIEPNLVVIDLIMPHIHGIEILKQIKQIPKFKKIGFIITSYHVMIQNHHAALEKGADYFLPKPFEIEKLFSIIAAFFRGNLSPPPFSLNPMHPLDQTHCYHPTTTMMNSYLCFWGTRGSNPVSGAEYLRYGGSTSCLEIKCDQDLLIIDAGTGICKLGKNLEKHTETINLFLSHTHWDHLIGFPFFAPLYNKNCHIVIWSPLGFEKTTKEIFTNMLAYTYFPVRLDELKAQISFRQLRDDQNIAIGKLILSCHFTNHPGATVGFKIQTPYKTIAYITDNEALLGYHGHPNKIHIKHPLLKPHLSLIEFLKDCDLIIHEAQYFPEEYHNKTGWGHSSIANAAVLLKYAGCTSWIVTHHDPNHTDSDLQTKMRFHHKVISDCHMNISVDLAYDGLMLPI